MREQAVSHPGVISAKAWNTPFLLLKSTVMLEDSGTQSGEKKEVFMPVEVSHSPDLLNAFPPEAEGLLGHFWSLGSIKN